MHYISDSYDPGSVCANSEMTNTDEATLTYPPDWEDEERMHFLLGPFPPTALLSVADQKVRFWSSLVSSTCRLLRQPVFSERQMAQRLQWRGQAPSCLHRVLYLMEQTGQLRLLQETEEGRVSGWFSWGISVVSRPIKWFWRGYLSPNNPALGNGVFVDTQLLQELADSVLQRLQSRVVFRITDQLLPRSQLKLVTGELVEASSVWVVEQELVRQGRLSIRTSRTGLQVVKFITAGESEPVHVSDMDEGILSLKASVTTLETHISSLEETVRRLRTKAKGCLQHNQRQQAVGCMRRCHRLQQLLSSKITMLDNLQHILHQIQMAETDVMVLEAYRKGTEVLKTIHKESGLSLLEAEKAVDELNEAVQDSEEVSAVLGEGVECDVEDEQELERELQDLLDMDSESHGHMHGTEDVEEDSLAERLSQLTIPPNRDPLEFGARPRPSVVLASGEKTKAPSSKHCQPQLT